MRSIRLAFLIAVSSVALYGAVVYFADDTKKDQQTVLQDRRSWNPYPGMMTELCLSVYSLLDQDSSSQLTTAISESKTVYVSQKLFDDYNVRVNNDLSVWKAFDWGNGQPVSPILIAAISKKPMDNGRYSVIMIHTSSASIVGEESREEFEQKVPWFRDGIDVADCLAR